ITACPVGGVSVTIIVTAVADSGMYFDTLTSIGSGSTGASGGTSACAICTRTGGGCISIVWFPIGILTTTDAFKTRKRGTRHQVPLHHLFFSAQKLNVIPVVAALIVAPPIVSLAASREQTW